MGILERIEESRQQVILKAQSDELARQQQKEAARLRTEQEKERKEQEAKIAATNYLNNTKTIIQILNALPEADYINYFVKVADFMGYSCSIALYSHPIPADLDLPKLPEAESLSPELCSVVVYTHFRRTAQKGKGMLSRHNLFKHYQWTGEPNEGLVLSPTTSFFGNQVFRDVEKKRRFFGSEIVQVPLTEPNLPGIGVNFSHFHESSVYHSDILERWDNKFHRNVYVRFLPQSEVIITNATGQRTIVMDSFKALDDAIEIGLKNPIIKEDKIIISSRGNYWPS